MSGIWHSTYHEPDQAWLITTTSGLIYKRCGSFSQACIEVISAEIEPDAFEAFVDWQRSSGRRLMKFSIDRLKWRRKREESHGPPIPPFEEF